MVSKLTESCLPPSNGNHSQRTALTRFCISADASTHRPTLLLIGRRFCLSADISTNRPMLLSIGRRFYPAADASIYRPTLLFIG